jgi:hypothetical protein
MEMYRRVFFIAVNSLLTSHFSFRSNRKFIVWAQVLPLTGNGALAATIGVFASVLFAVIFREASPFIRPFSNILFFASQYQIMVTYFGALIIRTQALSVIPSLNQ